MPLTNCPEPGSIEYQQKLIRELYSWHAGESASPGSEPIDRLRQAGGLLTQNLMPRRLEQIMERWPNLIYNQLSQLGNHGLDETQLCEHLRAADAPVPARNRPWTLSDADQASLALADDWKAQLATSGTLTGGMGILGAGVDIGFLCHGLNQLTTSIAWCYGCDPRDPQYAAMALGSIGIRSTRSISPNAQIPTALEGYAELRRIRDQLERDPEQSAVLLRGLYRRLAEAISTRLARGILARFVPLAGAALGGVLAHNMASQTAWHARNLFREHCLENIYGQDFLWDSQVFLRDQSSE